MDILFLIQTTISYTIPLMIVALAGVFAERSGVINIALDGMMIFGAFCGAVVVYSFKNAGVLSGAPQVQYIIAMLVATISGAAFSLLLSFSAVTLKADQTIGGTALNLLAPAITLLLTGALINVGQEQLVMPGDLGFVLTNGDANWFVKIFTDKIYISTYLAIILFIVMSIILYKTRFGFRLRSCGEHPQASASVGINVKKMRYLGTTISGALGGVGGYIYITTAAAGTAEGTVAGMGFLALAIMIFGNWKPLGIVLGALLFGLLTSLGAVGGIKGLNLPMYFYRIVPYAVVLIVLVFTSKKSRAPKAEGIPYDAGAR